ncbi:ankyrin repeat-containing domain protein [Mycena floridula]|nr:ankyrin repeat-containing domain protein [Mycena floridula]
MGPQATLLESLDKITSYALKLDLNSTRVAFFSRWTSLQTIMRFMGAQVIDNDVLPGLTRIVSGIATNLDMEQPRWPFSLDEERDILSAITSIESQLNSAQPQATSSKVSARDIDSIPSSNVKLSTYASGSSVHLHANHITGNVEGSVLSHNNIRFDADPAVRQGVDNLIEHVTDTKRIQKRKEFLDWISKLDFQATQIETFAKHAPGTGDWFFKKPEFVDWRDGKTKFLWCPGIPGAGKTTLSSIIVDHLQSRSGPDMAVLYIYCDYTRQTDQTPTQLVGTLLKQLVQHQSSIPDHILALYDNYSSRGAFPTSAELLTALHTEASFYHRVYIILDALDESSESNQARKLFLSVCSGQGPWSLSDHIHLLITSRDILLIAQEFHTAPRIPIEAHADDLETYIKGRILSDIKLERLIKGDVTLEAEIIDKVVTKAAGMFLQAQLHLDSLGSQLNRRALRTALSSLPKGIMDSYDAAMNRISAQGEAEKELALRVFYWLAYAQEPLSVKVLQHAVAVSEDMTDMDFDAVVDVELLTSICAGLIIIRKESSHYEPIVQLVHYTTHEYFQLKQHQLFPDIHPLMAITCLTYMSFDGLDITPNDIQATWKQYPLYKYAILHWGKHAQKDEVAVFQHILKFFEKKTNISYVKHYGSIFQRLTLTGKPHILIWFGLHQTLEIMLLKDPTYAYDLGENGLTPLEYACHNGHINVVQLLLSREDINSSSMNTNPGNSLLFAVQRGHMHIVQFLLQQKDVDLTISDKDQRSPLSYAAENGHLEIVKLLLHWKDMTFNKSDRHQRSPLSYAAENGHLDIIRILLQQENIDPNISTKEPPLTYAAAYGHLEILKLLLDSKNVNPNACDLYQRTALAYAAWKGDIDMVNVLLQQPDIDPNASRMEPPLSFAAANGHLDIVLLLLAHQDINVNASDTNRITSLGYAAMNGHFDIAEILVGEPDIDLSPTDYKQRTPLSYAAEEGHIKIVELLLQHGTVNPGASDKSQHSSLVHAMQKGHTALSYTEQGSFDTVKSLHEQKHVDFNACDKRQWTPLFYAAKRGHVGIVKLLLKQKGVEPNLPDKKHQIPLTYAVQWGQFDVVQLLIKYSDQLFINGALSIAISIADSIPDTPYWRVTCETYLKIVKLLQEYATDN